MRKILMLLAVVTLIGVVDVEAETKVYNENIVKAYTYDQTINSGYYVCIRGEESTCQETTCYKDGTCPAGTIIKYKVSDAETRTFFVLHDNGTTLTLQDRENLDVSTGLAWSNASNYTFGPITALDTLASHTSSWTNVNDLTYTLGTTNFNNTNAFTACNVSDNTFSCTVNSYTLAERTSKARMITVQEATAVGCSTLDKSCPVWMSNHLYESNYPDNETTNGIPINQGYWTLSALDGDNAWLVTNVGKLNYDARTNNTSYGIRPVVEVTKYTVNNITPDDDDAEDNGGTQDGSSTGSSNGTNKGSQTVKVGDTFKTAYIGYCIGTCILILGGMVVYQSVRKNKNEVKVENE